MEITHNMVGWFEIPVSDMERAILKGKTLITEEIGYMALLLDSEGNRIALHSRK